ncbi:MULTISPECIES: glutaminase [Flavobacterium]|uniref:Glutaminase n=1 Tax=Flavobacterium hankyongi TaxID=1176532 RepID=A0ABP9A3V9_9FLAO|nr:glutaminase [Flavobacterium sp. N1846]
MFEKVLQEIYKESKLQPKIGEIATYIPELANVNPDKFGISLLTLDGEEINLGDANERFSIQSISKPLTLSLAFTFLGEKIWERVGVEPSGSPFNSLVQLEYEKGIPRNPFINAGALVIADILVTHLKNPKTNFINFLREISDINTLDYDLSVAKSEASTGFRNIALANFLKSFGNITNNVDEVLDFYFHQCSISMSCSELNKVFYFFANEGVTLNGKEILNRSQIKRMNALMQSCGFYDESGEFTYRVGLPGKSGVGGGIVAMLPKKFIVSTWSPRLNSNGNSELGMFALEQLTTKTGMSIF